jgi:hypothetical protein
VLAAGQGLLAGGQAGDVALRAVDAPRFASFGKDAGLATEPIGALLA